MIMVLRFGFGMAQAGAYPTGAAVISKWVPFRGRGKASGIVAVGGRVGGVLPFYLTAQIILLLVPVSVSSRVGAGDLLEPSLFSQRLLSMAQPAPTGAKPADAESSEEARLSPALAASLLEHYSSQGRKLLDELSEQHRQREKQVKLEKTAKGNPPPSISVSQVDAQRLADGLNAAIAERDLFPSAAIPKKTPLRGALEGEAQRLLERPRSQLNQSEVERLNRLVLEAAFPGAIRKLYGLGWRPLMWIYGLAGLLVAGLYWFTTRDRPELHPRVNVQELALIEEGRPASQAKSQGPVGGVPIVRLVTSFSMWMLCLSQWFTNIGWLFIMVWAPRYFQMVHRVPIEERAILTAVPAFVGWFGMVGGGWLTDFMVRLVGLRWGRALPIALSRFLAMAAYAYCLLFAPSAVWAAVAFCVVAFATDLGSPATWAFNQDVGGRHVGSVLGWGNMWGNLGAAVTPLLLAYVVDIDGEANWNAAFIVCGGAFLLSGICALFVDATKPIDRGEKK
jgi:nitrate/nitrite transporter NarK